MVYVLMVSVLVVCFEVSVLYMLSVSEVSVFVVPVSDMSVFAVSLDKVFLTILVVLWPVQDGNFSDMLFYVVVKLQNKLLNMHCVRTWCFLI